MARTFTLVQLRTKARERADMASSQFVTDSELNGYISASYAWLYDLLVQSGLHYFEATQTITTDGNATFALDPTFYASLGVDRQLTSTRWIEVPEIMSQERNGFPAGGNIALAHRITGSNLTFYPAPAAGQTYRLIFIPAPVALDSAADGTTIDGVSGWEELIVLDAAIKCKRKEESDTGGLERERAAMVERIQQASTNRAWNTPRRVTDVDNPWSYDSEVYGDPAAWRYR